MGRKPVYTIGETYQMDVERGDSFSLSVTWVTLPNQTPVNLTGYYAELLDSDGNDITAAVSIPTPTSGIVSIAMTPAQTSTLNDKYFRLRVTDGVTAAYTLLEGRIDVS